MERAEVSKRNKYYISKHRYYELKHFCLQYPEWKHALDILDGWGKSPDDLTIVDAKGKPRPIQQKRLQPQELFIRSESN